MLLVNAILLFIIFGSLLVLFLFALYAAILMAEFYAIRLMRLIVRRDPQSYERTPEQQEEVEEAYNIVARRINK